MTTQRETELLAANAALKEQLSEANKERAWVRRKLEIPEDIGFLSGDVTLAGTMHNVWSGYRGYRNYIAAEKCDDKMGKIARQSVEIDALEVEVMRLREIIEKLWVVIDDIDTYSDMAKADDKLYRSLVERRQKDRWDTRINCDGHKLEFPTPFTPTALNDLVEEVEKRTIDRCAKEAFKLPEDIDEYESPIVAANKAIRALPTGQIKLEELP